MNEKKQKIYFTGTKDNKLTLYEYNLGNGENTMRLQSENKDDAFSNPYFMGKWVAVVSYPTSTIYYWNSDELDSIKEIQSIGINSIVEVNSEADKGDLLYTFEDETKLGLLDMEHDKNYNIDISSLISETKHPISFWYFNENTIYCQDICDWDLGENNPDRFYKIKLNTLLN